MARPRQLFIDLDGVLADFDSYYASEFGVVIDRSTPVDPPGFWDRIRQHPNFYGQLPKMADADVLWQGVHRYHPHPIILTGIPKSIPGIEQVKRNWIRDHLDPHAEVICCLSVDKRHHGIAGDVLVDDWTKYRGLWEGMGGVFILHTSAEDSLKQLDQLVWA